LRAKIRSSVARSEAVETYVWLLVERMIRSLVCGPLSSMMRASTRLRGEFGRKGVVDDDRCLETVYDLRGIAKVHIYEYRQLLGRGRLWPPMHVKKSHPPHTRWFVRGARHEQASQSVTA
jgi:hypothetical protein